MSLRFEYSPPGFDLDLRVLDAKYKQLEKQLHPDRHMHAPEVGCIPRRTDFFECTNALGIAGPWHVFSWCQLSFLACASLLSTLEYKALLKSHMTEPFLKFFVGSGLRRLCPGLSKHRAALAAQPVPLCFLYGCLTRISCSCSAFLELRRTAMCTCAVVDGEGRG